MEQFKKIFLVLFFFGIIMSGVFVLNKFFSKPYKEVVTKSGLKVLFLKDKDLPYIQFKLWFLKMGADYDEKNKSGLSMMTTSLLEQGAGGLSSEVIQENMDYLGARFWTYTGRQYSQLSISGLSWQAKDLWEIFLKIATEAHLEGEEFKLLKKRFIERRFSHLDHSLIVASGVWRQSLFGAGNSIAEPEEGTLSSLKNISLEDVKSFFQNHYLNSQPILTVVGEFTPELKQEIIASFDKQFDKRKESPVFVLPPKQNSFFKLLKKKNQVQSQIRMGFQSMAFPKDNPRLFVTLKLANIVLGDSFLSSRLVLKLREEMGLTYGVYSQIVLGPSYGVFLLTAMTKTATTGLFINETLKVLKKFQETGLTEEELKKAKTMLKIRYLKSIGTPEELLAEMVYYHYYLGVKDSFLDDYVSIIDKISLSELNEAIKKHLTPDNMNVLVYGHPSVKEQLLDIKGLSPLEEISFAEYFSQELEK